VSTASLFTAAASLHGIVDRPGQCTVRRVRGQAIAGHPYPCSAAASGRYNGRGSPRTLDDIQAVIPAGAGHPISIGIVAGGRSAVADLLLEHHRAYYRPRVEVLAPPPPAPSAPRPAARLLIPAIGPVGAVAQVLVIRVIACLVLWAAAGTVYGFWQLGNALVPTRPHGVVTCGTSHAMGSLPGC
jgi:hypothetical protein